MSALIERINSWVEQNRDTCITFLQGFIAAPSPSRNEREAAEYLAEGMRQFGFNVVKVDELFDVMGTIKGQGKGKTLLLNGHIDHVPAGEMVDPWMYLQVKWSTPGRVKYYPVSHLGKKVRWSTEELHVI